MQSPVLHQELPESHLWLLPLLHYGELEENNSSWLGTIPGLHLTAWRPAWGAAWDISP